MQKRSTFRAGVVAVVIHEDGKILLCERADKAGEWQFPQGGIESGETPEAALLRELGEELGNSNCKILKRSPQTTKYSWPQNLKKPRPGNDHQGQEQTWFLCQFLAGESPHLELSDGCFRAWDWFEVNEGLSKIIIWKRAAFSEGLKMLGLKIT